MNEAPKLLLAHHLKTLKLPTVLREYDKLAQQCAAEGVDFPRYLPRLSELELLDRERRATDRRIRQAKFDVVKSLDSFDFLAIPSLNKARCWNWPAASSSSGRKTHRPRAEWHGQNPCCPGPGACRLSEGPRRPLHDRRRLGP